MKFSDLGKSLKDAFVESDPNSTPKAPAAKPAATTSLNLGGFVPAVPSFPTAAIPNAGASPFAVPQAAVVDEAVYQRVLAKTDFNQTDVGLAVKKYFDGLPDSLDTNTRFKAALSQAAKLDGITPDRVLAAFDSLKALLQSEGDKFARAVDAQNQKEVVGRQQHLQQITDQINQLTQQIVDLQSQHTQVSAELADAQQKVNNAQTQFQLASQRRSNEIDQQKVQFSALLK